MAKKRGHGEGCISQRKDGRWSAIITVGHTTDGKRVRQTIYGSTKRDVTEQLTRLQNQKLDGTLKARERMTVSELLNRWLTSWSENLAPGSRRRYLEMANLYINPALGGMEVAKVQPVHVQALLDKLKSDGKGERTRQYVFATLRRPMNLALKLELILRNPCKPVTAPQAKPGQVQPPTAEEVSRLLDAASDSPWEAVFILAVDCGLRQGEIFALAWDDIDFDRRTIAVRHSLEELAGFLRIKEPKSASGRRVVKLPQSAMDALYSHRKRMLSAGKAGTPWLFTDEAGGFLRKSNFARRVWEPIKAAAELPDHVTFHDLRHAHASTLLRENVHPKIVQERLGHSSIKLTMDTYSHLMPDAQDVAAEAVDRVRQTHKFANGRQMVVKTNEKDSSKETDVA